MARWGENTRAIMLYAREGLFAADLDREWALSPGDRAIAVSRLAEANEDMIFAKNMFSR